MTTLSPLSPLQPETRCGVVYNPTAEAGTTRGPAQTRGLLLDLVENGWARHLRGFTQVVQDVRPSCAVLQLIFGLDAAVWPSRNAATWRQNLDAYHWAKVAGLDRVVDTDELAGVVKDIQEVCPAVGYIGPYTDEFSSLSRARRRVIIARSVADPYLSAGINILIMDGWSGRVDDQVQQETVEDIESYGIKLGGEHHHPRFGDRISLTTSASFASLGFEADPTLAQCRGVRLHINLGSTGNEMSRAMSLRAAMSRFIPCIGRTFWEGTGETSASWAAFVLANVPQPTPSPAASADAIVVRDAAVVENGGLV